MSVNIKLGNNTINGVSSVKLESADTPGTYETFSLGGGTPGPIVLKSFKLTSSNNAQYKTTITFTQDSGYDYVFVDYNGEACSASPKIRRSTDHGQTWGEWSDIAVGTTTLTSSTIYYMWEIGFFSGDEQVYWAGDAPSYGDIETRLDVHQYATGIAFQFANISPTANVEMSSNATFYRYANTWCDYTIQFGGEED